MVVHRILADFNFLQIELPPLAEIRASHCLDGHELGVCPLPKLNPPPIFKPRGVAKKVLEVKERTEATEESKAKAKVRQNCQITQRS